MRSIAELLVALRDAADDHPEALNKPLLLRHQGVDFDLSEQSSPAQKGKLPFALKKAAAVLFAGCPKALTGEVLVGLCKKISESAISKHLARLCEAGLRVLFCSKAQCLVLELPSA